MTTYVSKLLLVPALFALGIAALVLFVGCRVLIGALTRPAAVAEDAAD